MTLGGNTNLSIIITAIDRASATMSKMGNKLTQTGAKMKSVGKSMSMALTLPIVGLATVSVKASADFDNAMTKSLAIMETTAKQEKEMERVARKVAKSTAFSHKQAADSYFYLASAGLGANEAMAAMPAVASFAQAGAFDLALATDLLTDAQSALGLTIRDDAIANMENMVKVSDVLVKANTLANGSVQQFSEALTTEAGAALKSFGIDIEEGVAVLAAFADQGVKGQVAGSGLSRVLRLLTKAANNNKKEMEGLGIAVYDSEGEVRNMADIIENLEVAFEGMSDQQRTAGLESIGFSARIQGIILPLLGTSEAIRGYEKELRNAGDTTEQVAKKQLESFTNQMAMVKNQLVDVGITIGNVLMPYVKKLAEWIKNLVVKFQGLSPKMQKVVLVTLGIVAALGPLLMMLGMILPALPMIGAAFVALFSPIGLIIGVIGLLVGVFLYAKKHWSEICEGFKFVTQALGDKIYRIFTSIGDFFVRIWEGIKGIFFGALEFIKNIFLNWTVPGLIIGHWEGIKNFFIGFWEAVVSIFTNIGNFLKGVLIVWKEILRPIWQPIVDASKALITFFADWFKKIGDFIYEKWIGVKDKTREIWESISNTIKEKVEIINSFLTEKFNAIGDFIYSIWEKIKNFFAPVFNTISGIFTGFTNGIKDIWETVWNAIVGKIEWALDRIKGIVDKIKSAVSSAGDAVKNVGSKVSDFGKNVGGKVADVGRSIGGSVSSFWSRAKSGVSSLIGIGAGTEQYAEGGIVPGIGPRLATVHGGETIIPKNKSIGGGDINIYIQGGNYLDREAGEKFAEILGKMLRRELRY